MQPYNRLPYKQSVVYLLFIIYFDRVSYLDGRHEGRERIHPEEGEPRGRGFLRRRWRALLWVGVFTVFIREFEAKKESEISFKKVDFGSFFPVKKVVLMFSNYDFRKRLRKMSERLCESSPQCQLWQA